MQASEASSQPGCYTRLAAPENPLGFRAPQAEDIHWVKPILSAAGRRGCEFAWGNIYAWAHAYGTQITQHQGWLLARSGLWSPHNNGQVAYAMPLCQAEPTAAALGQVLQLLRKDAQRHGTPLHLYGVTQSDIPLLEAASPGGFVFEPRRDEADYLYLRSDLQDLPGKKYHKKRNHAQRFARENQWSYAPMAPQDHDECLAMARVWASENAEKDPQGLQDEQQALERSFAHFAAFGFVGGVLRAGALGSADLPVVAFTLGEPLSPTLFCTHFEKAFAQTAGAYQMINRCFAAQLQGYTTLNREEDMGLEGLRKAKLSYAPCELLEKFDATQTG